MQYESVRDYCLNKWSVSEDDPRIKHFKNVLKDFNDMLPDTMDKCVEAMLRKFDYYSKKQVNQELMELHKQFTAQYNVNINNTIYSVLKSQIPKFNSSYMYLAEYKMLNNLSKHLFVPELKDIINEPEWDCIKNIVLVDDMCGTGKTLIDFILDIKTKLLNKTVYYLVVHTMADAKMRIERKAAENGLKVIVIARKIKDAAFLYDELSSYKQQFIQGSMELGINKMADILGFSYPSEADSYSEALVAFHEDTPNNTLGIFWKTTDKNKPLFPRENDKKPDWKIMMEKRRRKMKSNYSSKAQGYKNG